MKQIYLFIYLLIGIVLALVVCITPVAAVSADDFEIVTGKDGKLNTYTYSNVNNPDEGYTKITTDSTRYSYVTFKPANIPDAPVMVVDTDRPADIYLTRIVDDWEIKFYSSSEPLSYPDWKYLKNAGVVNLNEFFGKYIEKRLVLERSQGQYIRPGNRWDHKYRIPDVD